MPIFAPGALSLQDLPNPRPRQSAAAGWPPLVRFVAAEARLADWAAKRPLTAFIYEFVRFGVKQAWACLFGGAMLALILGTYFWYPRGAPLARYDFIFLAAVAVQIAMLAWRLETFDEAKVILIYHVVGTIMEVFKTDVGSWIYPEPSIFHIEGVPLFSGFMDASIGSYIARSWRLFDFRFARHPPLWSVNFLALAVYANFFTHHHIVDRATFCLRRRRCCSAEPGSIIGSTMSTGGCRCCSACSWWRCSSGLPRISAR
jgi:hypothetical protein